jgi:RNA polymerase primary sigma factor
MRKRENNRKPHNQNANDLQLIWADSSLSDHILDHLLEEGGIESFIKLLELGKEQGILHLADVIDLIPEAEEDLELLERISNFLDSIEIQLIKDEDGQTESDDVRFQEKFQSEAAEAGDTVGLYLSQVSAVPLLSHDEEIGLAKRIEQGREASHEMANGRINGRRKSILKHLVEDGQIAREHLLLANVRLVFSIAKKYRGRGVPLLDLVQEGHIGLMRATKKFDYRRGHKFSTYATWWVRQAITRHLADHGRTIRLPVHMGDRINKLLSTRHRIIQELGREPDIRDLAEELGEPRENISNMLRYAQRALSLDLPVGFDNDSTLVDYVKNEDAVDPVEMTTQQMLSEHVNKVLEMLPPREARILRLRFGLSSRRSHTLNEIGTKLGVSRERVRQIEAQAKDRIQRYGLKEQLKEYLRE